jgi:hypothetical protein
LKAVSLQFDVRIANEAVIAHDLAKAAHISVQ